MSFGLAVEALKKGLKVRFQDWKHDSYLIMYSYMPHEHSKELYEVITICSGQGRAQWMPINQDEILQDKWVIVD